MKIIKESNELNNRFTNIDKIPINESEDKSFISKNHKQRGYIALSKFNVFKIQHQNEGNSFTLCWKDKDNKFVGKITIDSIPASDGYRWFGDLVVSKKYRGYNIGEQILNLATDKYKAGALAVYKDNQIAYEMYKKHGFEIGPNDGRDEDFYYMYLERNKETLTSDMYGLSEGRSIQNHKKKQKGLSPFSYLNPDAGNVEKGIEVFNNSTFTSDGGSIGGMSESLSEELNKDQLKAIKIIQRKYPYITITASNMKNGNGRIVIDSREFNPNVAIEKLDSIVDDIDRLIGMNYQIRYEKPLEQKDLNYPNYHLFRLVISIEPLPQINRIDDIVYNPDTDAWEMNGMQFVNYEDALEYVDEVINR